MRDSQQSSAHNSEHFSCQQSSRNSSTLRNSATINSAMKSLSLGLKLSATEERALRLYKAAVAELQAYSDTELAELGICRSKIFKYALVWQLDYDRYLIDAAA